LNLGSLGDVKTGEKNKLKVLELTLTVHEDMRRISGRNLIKFLLFM
jgi:hypothetical protein